MPTSEAPKDGGAPCLGVGMFFAAGALVIGAFVLGNLGAFGGLGLLLAIPLTLLVGILVFAGRRMIPRRTDLDE